MYAVRTEVMVGAGKVRAFEAWWAQLSALAKAQRGFQEGTLLNSRVLTILTFSKLLEIERG